jgi:hypothetical protein
LVERGTSNAEVTGSTPLGGSDFLLFFALSQTVVSAQCVRYGLHLLLLLVDGCVDVKLAAWNFVL